MFNNFVWQSFLPRVSLPFKKLPFWKFSNPALSSLARVCRVAIFPASLILCRSRSYGLSVLTAVRFLATQVATTEQSFLLCSALLLPFKSSPFGSFDRRVHLLLCKVLQIHKKFSFCERSASLALKNILT